MLDPTTDSLPDAARVDAQRPAARKPTNGEGNAQNRPPARGLTLNDFLFGRRVSRGAAS